MRWIFISLIIMNLAYLGWELWTQHTNTGSGAAQTTLASHQKGDEDYVPRIVLLEEAKSVDLAYENAKPSEQETAPRATRPAAAPTPLASISSVAVRKEQLCPSIGPYTSEKDAESLVDELGGMQVNADISQVVTERYEENWVIIPPLESRAAAISKLRELQARGIDSYVITQGDWRNAVSLGLFKRKSSAIGLKDKMVSAGHPAELRVVEREEYEYWVKIPPEDYGEEVKQALQSRLAGKSEINLQESLCK